MSDNPLHSAALEAQAFFLSEQGILYSVEDLLSAFEAWIADSTQELINDAFVLCIEGDRNLASFNRSAFTKAIAKLKPCKP